MPTRRLDSPQFEIEEDGAEDILIRFLVPGSKFGSVEVVYSHAEAGVLVEHLDQALVFAGATGGDSDG